MSAQRRSALRFDVYGRIVDLRRTAAGWQATYPGAEGKGRTAPDIEIPAQVEEAALADYLADLCHEWAAPGRSVVRLLGDGEAAPAPPLLVVRPGLAFWVEDRPPERWSATLRSFEEGCFREARCYDQGGNSWQVVAAELGEPPSLLDRLLPWRQVPVVVTLGAQRPVDLGEIVELLGAVLRSESEFLDHLESPPEELVKRFEAAADMAEILRIAHELG